MVDREGDLAQLDQAHVAATTGFRGHRLVGPVGVGKTYLLEAFLRRRRLAGDVVALAGPDPWRARVRYSTLRSIIGSLLELPAADIPGAAGADAPAEARVGLNLLYGVGSDHGAEPLRHWSDGPPRAWRHAERRRLAAEALRWAMTRAHAERPDATIVVAVDDLQAVDGASRNALADVAGSPPPIPLLLLAAHEPGFEPRWTASQEHVLRGFGPTHVTELLDAGPPVSVPRLALSDPGAGPQEVRPLHVEQLQRFLAEGGANPPAGVADLVAARLGRLTAQRRRILQAVAVLGDGASADAIAEMLATSDPLSRELDRLRARGWLTVIPEPDELWSMHPLVRDVTLASMPAEIRRELHGRARAVSAHQGAPRPVEVDAQHACGAGQSFEALMLLERVATRSAVCGDFDGAVRALRQGLELGREEIVRGEIDDPVGATLWFSCRLGDVLALDGDLRNADGVLREALDQAGPASGLRPRILASLAHVCHQRGRSAQARELLDEAHRLAAERGRRGVLEACVQLRMSWVGQEAG
jgi:serine/threonine-protein kinase